MNPAKMKTYTIKGVPCVMRGDMKLPNYRKKVGSGQVPDGQWGFGESWLDPKKRKRNLTDAVIAGWPVTETIWYQEPPK